MNKREQKTKEHEAMAHRFSLVLYIAFNAVSTLIFIFLTIFTVIKTWGISSLIYYVIPLMAIYVIILIVTLVISSKDEAKLKSRVTRFTNVAKNSKSALKILIKLNLLITIIIAIIFAVTSGNQDNEARGYTIATAVLSAFIALVLIAFEIYKIYRRQKKAKLKKQKMLLEESEHEKKDRTKSSLKDGNSL